MIPEPHSRLSCNLVYLRKTLGLSQTQLASRAGLSRRIISHYETAATSAPLDNLEAIAEALGVPLARLLDETPENRTETSLADIDPRNVKKLRDILSLPPEDQLEVYRLVKKLRKKNNLI